MIELIDVALPTLKKSSLSIECLEQVMPFEAGITDNNRRPGRILEAAPERLKQFEIIWIKTGTGNFHIDLFRYEVRDNTLYFLYPGQIFLHDQTSGISGYRISCSKEFLRQPDESHILPLVMDFQYGNFNSQLMQVSKETEVEIERILRMMVWENSNFFQLKTELLRRLLKTFINYLSRRSEVKHTSDGSVNDVRLFSNFMELVSQDYLTKKAVADYADKLSVSPNYLSEVVKKVSRHSASYHIQQRLILEAKRAAVYSRVSMKEVSYQLGFLDPAQFSKFFKNKTGVNFSIYKKQLAAFGK